MLHLDVYGNENGSIHATLVDVTGRTVLHETLTGNTADLNISQLPAGTYLLRCEGSAGTYHTMVVIAR